APLAGQRIVAPHLDQQAHRTATDVLGLRIEGQLCADGHRHHERHALDGHCGYPATGDLAGHGGARQVHLCNQPATVDIAEAVGLTWQRGELHGQVALGNRIVQFQVVIFSHGVKALGHRRYRCCGRRVWIKKHRSAVYRQPGGRATMTADVIQLSYCIHRLVTRPADTGPRSIPIPRVQEQGMKLKRLMAAMTFVAAGVTSVGAMAAVDPALSSYAKTSGVSGNLSSVGSDSLANLMTLWAEEFKLSYPNVDIQIQAAGSSTAPPSLSEGSGNMGPMSRPMKDSEIQAFEQKYGYKPTAVPVAIDAL